MIKIIAAMHHLVFVVPFINRTSISVLQLPNNSGALQPRPHLKTWNMSFRAHKKNHWGLIGWSVYLGLISDSSHVKIHIMTHMTNRRI